MKKILLLLSVVVVSLAAPAAVMVVSLAAEVEEQESVPEILALWDTIVAFDDLPVGFPPHPSLAYILTPSIVDLWGAASIMCGVIDLDIPLNIRVTTSTCGLSATDSSVLFASRGTSGDTVIFKVLYPF